MMHDFAFPIDINWIYDAVNDFLRKQNAKEDKTKERLGDIQDIYMQVENEDAMNK